METLKRYILLIFSFVSLFLLAGFTGKEKYIELQGYLNARDSSSFHADDGNVVSILNTGTRGEILESKKMNSGNYGLRIKVMTGAKAGETVWVYYDVKSPALELYETKPTTWDQNQKEVAKTTQPEKAKSTKVTHETKALPDRSNETAAAPLAGSLSRPAKATAARGGADGLTAAKLIERSNKEITKASQQPCAYCSNATTTGAATPKSTLPLKHAGLAGQCSQLVSPDGRLGSLGKSIYSTMAEAKYSKYFTANGSLGSFCPNFNHLQPAQRLQAWTWFWTSLANEESGCTVNKIHPTTIRDRRGRLITINPRAGYGLWAMEKDRNIRRGRGAACDDISSGAGQARCAIDIMVDTQLSEGKPASVTHGSYWGPIHRGRAQIIPHMKKLALCYPK